MKIPKFLTSSLLLLASLLLTACQSPAAPTTSTPNPAPSAVFATPTHDPLLPSPTPLPTRPIYDPATLVEYTAQTGDTLPGLAAHFNTTVEQILQANPIVPTSATTLPPGLPMQIPIYYLSYWGTPFQIIPDSHYVNGPALLDFEAPDYVAQYPGWLNGFEEYAAGANRSGAEIVQYVAAYFSVSPRLLLALLEFQAGALSDPAITAEEAQYALGNQDPYHKGVYLQLVWAANLLNHGYYGWRSGLLDSFDRLSGRMERPDPWQNAASVSIQNYFVQFLDGDDYARAVGPEGLARAYQVMFGDPWLSDQPHIPGSLEQPALTFPFLPGKTWAFTGGPHTGYGTMQPWAALDFAPPAMLGGCQPSSEWVTAMADGLVARSDPALVVLDLDGDGDERTGWTLFYFHLASEGRAQEGETLQTGDRVGYPSCEGGIATGTHVHVARKYNGEWIMAFGALAFNLEGWVVESAGQPYEGVMTRFTRTVVACECSTQDSQVTAGE